MNTQNTPVHPHLWNRDFWLLALANLLLSMSVYALVPVLPHWLFEEENFTPLETGLSMGAFGVGLWTFGLFCSWLVQHYRRNVVCLWAVAAVALDVALLWYIDGLKSEFVELGVILLQRLLLGATFGLAQMVLSSTLVIDTCESFQRTEANHSSTWFARFALSLGPLSALMVQHFWGHGAVLLMAVSCAVAAGVLIKLVSFPFRAPDDTLRVTSLDRFFLPQGKVLFANLVVFTLVVGLLLSLPLTYEFYAYMMVGFFMALLAQRFVFLNAELESEVVTGLILMGAALLVLLQSLTSPIPPLFIGFSVGIIGSRFLLFFIKLSHHCQRGTSQSTFFLGWESGIAVGMGAGYALFYGSTESLLYTALALTAAALAMYHGYTHRWFLRHKNR